MQKKIQPVLSEDEIDERIVAAAQGANYLEGFGVKGCNLSNPGLWAAYTRQSLVEQAQNNRLFDYLRTCAQEAKKLGVVVPREYVLYDAVTGEHLERPDMIRLRALIADRKISGVLFPALDRLSREPLHQSIFELEAGHYGVKLQYADAPSGDDPGSQFARNILVHAAKMVKLSNRRNARGGNIGRVLKGWVPAHRAAYGYRYMAEREIGPDARVVILKAWWEVDELGPEGEPIEGSPAWVVTQVFTWIGAEERTLYWVVQRLNELGIPTSRGAKWSPAKVAKIVRHRSYTGNHAYNVNMRIPNPARPLGDITAEVKRTLLKSKPEEEWAKYKVPQLVDEALWEKANNNLTQRGRGKGRQGKSIHALLRNRIICPGCNRPMIVKRGRKPDQLFYHCSKYFRPWAAEPCGYRRFISGKWDGVVWSDICALLRNDAWIEKELHLQKSQTSGVDKLIRLQGAKISQAQAKVRKVQQGFEGGIYTLEDAKRRLSQLQEMVATLEQELLRLQKLASQPPLETASLGEMMEELSELRNRNLDTATFDERLELVSKLGIKIYPSEDLKSMKVQCQLNLPRTHTLHQGDNTGGPKSREEHKAPVEYGEVSYAPPNRAISRTD